MEEGGLKLLLVIRIESHQKIKLNKNRSIFVLNDFITSLFHHPASNLHPSYSYPELRLNNKKP